MNFERRHIGKRYEKGVSVGVVLVLSEIYYKLSRVGRVDMVQHRSSRLEMEMVRKKRRLSRSFYSKLERQSTYHPMQPLAKPI